MDSHQSGKIAGLVVNVEATSNDVAQGARDEAAQALQQSIKTMIGLALR